MPSDKDNILPTTTEIKLIGSSFLVLFEFVQKIKPLIAVLSSQAGISCQGSS